MSEEKSMTSHEVLEIVPSLDAESRQEAREKARELVVRKVGPRPDRDQFKDRRISPYPRWITATTLVLLVVLFLATFMPSMFRLFTAGRNQFFKTIADPYQAAVVGIAIFLMAEISVILATIVQKIYFEGSSQHVLNATITLGVLITMFGNIYIAQPEIAFSASAIFQWLETLGPSIFVFATSFILKQIMFTSLEHRIQNESDYQEALYSWEEVFNNPEDHPRFMQVYGNTLRDAITKSYVVGSKAKERREYLNSLNRHDWISLVLREMREENWMPNIVEGDVVDATSHQEVGLTQIPLHPQPSYGFQTDQTPQ